jgi:hypothetical protein
MATIRNLARWIAWQIGEHDAPAYQPPAHITFFSSDLGGDVA